MAAWTDGMGQNGMRQGDDDGIVLTEEQKRRRRARSIAIALALGGLVLLFYVLTIVKVGHGFLKGPS
jgi:hypothetical protein